MKRLLLLIALGAVGALGFRAFLFEGIYLASNSMAPTLPQGTHVFANKLLPRLRGVKRKDIVMFETPQMGEKGMVKRVIAVGGDVLEIRDKRVYLNYRLLNEPYVQHTRPNEILRGDRIRAIKIPENHVFVMGDNRDESGDSRDWKAPSGDWSPFVPLDNITGIISPP